MYIALFILFHWYLSLFFKHSFCIGMHLTICLKCLLFWEKTFFFLTFIFQGSSFLNPAAYAIMHRRHHQHTDAEKDPHSPLFITKYNILQRCHCDEISRISCKFKKWYHFDREEFTQVEFHRKFG